MDDDDDEFDSLFSFSSPAAGAAPTAASGGGADDDLLANLGLADGDGIGGTSAAAAAAAGTGAADGTDANADDDFLELLGDSSAPSASPSAVAAPSANSIEDEFDALFDDDAPAASVSASAPAPRNSQSSPSPPHGLEAEFELLGADSDESGGADEVSTVPAVKEEVAAVLAPEAAVDPSANDAAEEAAGEAAPAPAPAQATSAPPAPPAPPAPAVETKPEPQAPAALPEDDFEVHDEDTQDMLDMLGPTTSEDADDFGIGMALDAPPSPERHGRSASSSSVSSSAAPPSSPRRARGGSSDSEGTGLDFEKDILGVVRDDDDKEVEGRADEGVQERGGPDGAGAGADGAAPADQRSAAAVRAAAATKLNLFARSRSDGKKEERTGSDLFKGLVGPMRQRSASPKNENEEKGGDAAAAPPGENGKKALGGGMSSLLASAKEKMKRETQGEDEAKEQDQPKPVTPLKPPPPKFETLSEAVRSPLSTSSQIREMVEDLRKEDMGSGPSVSSELISSEDRPFLWCKLLAGKTLDGLAGSSLAEGFRAWDATFGLEDVDGLLGDQTSSELATPSPVYQGLDLDLLAKVRAEARELASRLSSLDSAERDLCSVLLFHYRGTAQHTVAASPRKLSKDIDEKAADPDAEKKSAGPEPKSAGQAATKEQVDAANKKEAATIGQAEYDPLLAPIVAVLLSASISPQVVSVMLTRIFPTTLPFMALSDVGSSVERSSEEDSLEPYPERTVAARSMHAELYLLACYHLPLLVTHLDRYCPGWHWPRKVDTAMGLPSQIFKVDKRSANSGQASIQKNEATEVGRHPKQFGCIPMSWFVSQVAGQVGSTNMDPVQLLYLWDTLIVSSDPSLKYFLALSVFEDNSDALLVLRGKELGEELNNIMSFGDKAARMSEDDFVGAVAGSNVSNAGAEEAGVKIRAWVTKARVLEQSTPRSVLVGLRSAEDSAVASALDRRRVLSEQKVKTKLDAEAQAHREAQAEQRKKRAEDAKEKLIRARLSQYYRRQNPTKVANIDKIMVAYKGRYEVLDKQLRDKYGHGFLPQMPSINPQLSNTTNKLLSTMGTELKDQKAKLAEKVETARKKRKDVVEVEARPKEDHGVSVKVEADEVLPIICSRSAAAKGLKYYLVDSRPDGTAVEQGRFPTSIGLSPEALMDPDRIQAQVETFESLRGAVHIVIMGEGLSSFPSLFDHPLSSRERILAEEDDSRTSLCALFFIKRGFPFISILDGGFAAAHSWLSRKGPSFGELTTTTALIDYDKDISNFAELEHAYQEQKALANSSTSERTAKALQKLIDRNMTSLTVSESRIEEMYADLASKERREKVRQTVSNQTAKVGSAFAGLKNINIAVATDSGARKTLSSSADSGSAGVGEGPRSSTASLANFSNPFAKQNTVDGKKNDGEGFKGIKLPQQSEIFKKMNMSGLSTIKMPSKASNQDSSGQGGSDSVAPKLVELKPSQPGKFNFLVAPKNTGNVASGAKEVSTGSTAAIATAPKTEKISGKAKFSFLTISSKTNEGGDGTTKFGQDVSARFEDALTQARKSMKVSAPPSMPSQIKNPFAKLSAKGDSSAEKEDIRSTKFASSLEASANKFKDKMASLRTKASNSSAESDLEPEGEDIISFHFEGDDEGGEEIETEPELPSEST